MALFGVASDFRKTKGEAAFKILCRNTFAEADVDGSGCIDMSELQKTLGKMGMKLNDAQIEAVIKMYDVDGNRELDQEEFTKLASDLIDGTATKKLPAGAAQAAARVEARGIVKSIDDLFGDDDDKPKKKAVKPAAKGKPASTPAAPTSDPAKLKEENKTLKSQNDELTSRVKQLEAELKKSKR